jgi:hypothetical protein
VHVTVTVEQVVVNAGSDWVSAAIAIGGTALGGVLGWLGSRSSQERSIKAQTSAAEEDRRQQRRADAYLRLLAWLWRAKTQLMRTLPQFGIGLEAPAGLTLEETTDLEAHVAAFASDEVRNLYDLWWRDYGGFLINAGALQEERQMSPGPPGSAATRREFRETMEARRQAALEGIRAIESAVRRELATTTTNPASAGRARRFARPRGDRLDRSRSPGTGDRNDLA